MILSNTAIFEALDDGRLVIDPEPAPRLSETGGALSPFGTSAVDLRLGQYLAIPKNVPHALIDLARVGDVSATLAALTDSWDLASRPYDLEPGSFILGQTLERVHLRLPPMFAKEAVGKPALAARVEGKSSRARFGILVHFTAPTIHAGWDGPIALEITCLGTAPLRLSAGLSICQLIIEQLEGFPSGSESQFQGQQRPTGTS